MNTRNLSYSINESLLMQVNIFAKEKHQYLKIIPLLEYILHTNAKYFLRNLESNTLYIILL